MYLYYLLIGVIVTYGNGAGMLCSESLYAQRTGGIRGELMRSWEYPSSGWELSAYEPRSTSYSLEPIDDDQDKNMYMGLDWLGTWTRGQNEFRNFLHIEYQRPAKTYLFVTANGGKNPKLSGWKSEGWAKRPSGAKKAKLAVGVTDEKLEFGMSSKGFVFSKVGTSVTIPSKGYLKKNIKNCKTSGHFSVLIAESDGSPPVPPTGNRNVVPGQLCPSWLHDTWFVGGFDESDTDTFTHSFRTYHPLLDPCFFCSYGHEHGSNTPVLTGYWPRYEYMAIKNGNEDESHEGFKDYVLDLGKYLLYYNVHAHLSRDRRLTEQFHTNVVRIVTKKDLKKVLHIQYKAFYGPLVALDKDGDRVGLTPEDEALRKNLTNGKRIGREIQIASVPLVIKYEIWATIPMCSSTKAFREPKVLIKDPQTGLQDPVLDKKEFVTYGRNGLSREFRSEDWKLAIENCRFAEDLNSEEIQSGMFYTDPKGEERMEGPGPESVLQYIEPGFSISVSGAYETTDTWLGLFTHGARGRFQNINNGVVGMMN